MIQIPEKSTETSIFFPLNYEETGEIYEVHLANTATRELLTIPVENPVYDAFGFTIVVDTTNIADGEYYYTIAGGLSIGIIKFGTNNENNKYNNSNHENKFYNG